MARLLYGCTSGDYTLNPSGRIIPKTGPLPVYDARVGVTRVTDLLDIDGNPVTAVTSDATGLVGVYAPDGRTAPMWLEPKPGGPRVALRPVDPPGGGGGVSDHGALSGLGDDDHPQYLRTDGSRSVAGDLTVAGHLTVDGAMGVVAHRVTLSQNPADDAEVATKGYTDTADARTAPSVSRPRRRAVTFADTFTRADGPLKNTVSDSGDTWRGGTGFLISGGTVVRDPALVARDFLMVDGIAPDIELVAKIHIGTDADVGLVGRCYQDTSVSTKLYLSMRKTAAVNTFRLLDRDGLALATVSGALADNTDYTVTWVMSGTNHRVLLNGTQIIDVNTTNPIYTDYAGFGVTFNGGYANTNTRIDDVTVRALEAVDAVVLAHRATTWRLGETTEQKVPTVSKLPPVSGLECDVRLSSDDVPVLMHDTTVDRTCPPHTGLVADHTADELAAMGVATLEEFLDEAMRYDHLLLLQTQVPNTEYAPIMAVLNALPSHHRLILGDYSNTNLQAAKTAGFKGATLLFGATMANVATLVGYAPDYIAIAPGDSSYMTNRAAVSTIKNAGIIPVASTVNRGDVVKAAVADGAVLLTDVAEACAAALNPVRHRARIDADVATKPYVADSFGTRVLAGTNIEVDTTTVPGSVILNVAAPVGAHHLASEWIWHAAPETPPLNPGRCGVNTDDVSASAYLYLHKQDVGNLDWSFHIAGMAAGWTVYAQDYSDSDSWHRWTLTGTPTVTADTWSIPVQTLGGSPQGTEPANNAHILVAFETPATDVATKASVKSIVAASADFADFKTRIAAW